MDLLKCQVMNYPWGSKRLLRSMCGEFVDSELPEAEMWIGAHPGGPSLLTRAGVDLSLDTVISSDSVREIGDASSRRFGGELSFLLKILAIDSPLSLQLHPNEEQARTGFEAKARSGVSGDEVVGLFADDRHKPELVVALTDFEALCGFRPIESARALLEAADAGPIGARFLAILDESDAASLLDCFDVAFGSAPTEVADSVALLGRQTPGDGEPFGSARRWLSELARRWPRDPAVLVATLLELVELKPGEGLFVEAGRLHTYLSGLAVEVMASSDNVLRAGLTEKHVDARAVRDMAIFEVAPARVQAPLSNIWTYDSPVEEFQLTRVRLDGSSHAVAGGQGIAAVVTDGFLRFENDASVLHGTPGAAIWCAANEGEILLSGCGTAYLAMDQVPL